MYKTFHVIFLFVGLSLSFLIPTTALPENVTNFVTIKLPRGIQLQIPKGWWLLGSDENRLIEKSVEAVLDLSGEGTPDGQNTNLIAANSMPKSTYASVRVNSRIPPSVTPSEFSSVTSKVLQELQAEMKRFIEKTLPFQGRKLIEFSGSRIEKLSGYPAIVTEYRRSGPKGPVSVQSNAIFTKRQEIHIILSYRESEAALWKPVVAKIRKSIVIKNWTDK